MSNEERDLILELIEEEADEEVEVYLGDPSKRKLTIKEQYEIEEKHWYYKYRTKVLKVLLDMQIKGENLKIADIGVHTGRLSSYLNKFGEVVRTENNREVIKFLKKKGLNVVFGELPWNLQIPDDYFDYVLMLNTLEYIEDDQWSLVSVAKKLKEDGKLILSLLANKNLYGLHEKTYGVVRRYSKEEIEKKLLEAGFKIDYLTFYESAISTTQSLKALKDKIFQEETLHLNIVPENNEDLYNNAITDIKYIKTKALTKGNQIFIVCSKATEEEKERIIKERMENSFTSKITKIFKKE